ncbi:TOM1-like protein 1 [Hypanus sabinus]|uniref:TOM1-like protein 1 n=1 Tax=Hypanus sabinus TaxID=79690 RepID=UPI0028C4EAC6|nr:TOM1-like protein 1 [Hypanus sabinus]
MGLMWMVTLGRTVLDRFREWIRCRCVPPPVPPRVPARSASPTAGSESSRSGTGRMAFGKSPKDPFSTCVGKLIDNATVGTQPAADWSRYNHICDVINSAEDGPKDAVRALKKRMMGNRNHKEIRLALALTDCCVGKCGPAFHSRLLRRDFTRDVLVKLLKPKYNLPTDIQDHILSMIQFWAIIYQGPADVSDVRDLYMEMKQKGVMFPAPAQGPPRIRVDLAGTSLPRQRPTAPAVKPAASRAPLRSNIITLVPEQVAKLHSELDVVNMNLGVMSAILLDSTPGHENPDDMQLLQKLHTTCRAMQERIGLLLLQVDHQQLTHCLLSTNDQLNKVFLQYERFQRNRTRFQWTEKAAADTPKVLPVDPSAPCSTDDLISFTCPEPAPLCTNQYTSLSLRNGNTGVNVNVVNPSMRSRALPEVPSRNTVPAQQLQPSQSFSGSIPEPLYANVDSQGTELLEAPTPGPSHTKWPCEHTATSQSEPSKIVGPQLIGLEFDPLANLNNSEAIYEDLDSILNKAQT